ncbi:MAG: hypothetical protein MPJ24_10620 [Pirellulaceae bacterium]|nr:hypothetical protein [Pirellulaceae bacterium]
MSPLHRYLVIVFVLFWGGFFSTLTIAQDRIQIEIAVEKSSLMREVHQWVQALQKNGITNVRVTYGKVEVKVTQTGPPENRYYTVYGKLGADGKLHLPGKTFTLSNVSHVKSWASDLRSGGVDEVVGEKGEFGLTKKQLIALYEDLTPDSLVVTDKKRFATVIKELAAEIATPVIVDQTAAKILESEEIYSGQLTGLSRGTALAIALQRCGHLMIPENVGGKISLRILPKGDQKEFWPAGWPPNQPTQKLFPAILTLLPVQMENIPLQQALDAVEERLKVPFIYDLYKLNAMKIDPNKIMVTIPESTITYKSLLDKVLRKAHMYGEVRIDEAGRPFYWISTHRISPLKKK